MQNFNLIKSKAVFSAFLACLICIAMVFAGCATKDEPTDAAASATTSDTSSVVSTPAASTPDDTTSSEIESDASDTTSSTESDITSDTSSTTSNPTTPSTPSTPSTPNTPSGGTDHVYNSNMTYDNNVFLDALKYTGYKTDARMWGAYGNYVLCKQKKGLGWLSNITYDDYGRSSGYEVNSLGKPDISFFEQKGLVCASYVAYVYFNYLPNVAGIDTSMLPKAENPVLANDWYKAAKQWVELGYSRYINFTASDNGSIYQDLKIVPEEEIPIGSLIFLNNWYNRTDWSTHVSIYAGKVNGYHWVTHVGNENGPELCAIERMNRLPHPQWMLAIVTPPSNIRFSAALEVTVSDENGSAIGNVEVTAKNKSSGDVKNLGKTDANGKVSIEGLAYSEYEITQSVPEGYTCEQNTKTIKLTTANNSLTTASFTNNVIKVEETPETEETEPEIPDDAVIADGKREENSEVIEQEETESTEE